MFSDIDILVLGATGMLGHKMFQQLRRRFPRTWGTIRGSIDDPFLCNVDLLHSGNIFERLDTTDRTALTGFLTKHRPKVVVNCVGIVKQKVESTNAITSILTNALLPHQLAEVSMPWAGRVIHFSTDCVFSGRRGNYKEDDLSDAQDFYGKSKALGELLPGNTVTLRTSMIGRELLSFRSLLEWFLAHNHSRVPGYRRALYSGTSTNELATIVGDLIEFHPELTGLYQVTGPTISKFDLLTLVRNVYGLDIEMIPDDEFSCDRSMNGDKFRAATGYVRPGWPELIQDLAGDDTPYEQWRAPKHVLL